MNNIEGWNGVDLAASNLGTVAYGAFLNPELTLMEIFSYDPTTIATDPISFVLRGLKFDGDLTTEVAANKLTWLKTETIVMLGSDVPQLLNHLAVLIADETVAGKWTYPSTEAARPRLDADVDTAVDEALVSFGQLARQAIAGAANASTTVAGLVEEATQAEAEAGTPAGSVARLFVSPGVLQTILQGQKSIFITEDGAGADDTYTGTATPTLTTYDEGQTFRTKITIANTGAATFNIDALGALALKKYVEGAKVDIATDDIVANWHGIWLYDGVDLVLQSMSADMPTTAILAEMASFFSTTDITGAEAETLTDGSDASSLHTHSDRKPRTVFRPDEDTAFDSTGAGSVAFQEMTYKLTTDGSGNPQAITIVDSNIGSFDKDHVIDVFAKIVGTNNNAFIGIGEVTVPTDHLSTIRHAGFFIDDAAVHASLADGSTQEVSADLSLTVTDWNQYRIEFTAAGNTLFYVNGTLVSTLSTNQPSGSTNYKSYRIGVEGDNADEMFGTYPLIEIEP